MAVRFRLENVSRIYGRRRWPERATGHRALEGVNLDLVEGETCALTGDSGAGKSTLARIVLGRERPDGGRVFFQGRPLALVGRADFNRRNQLMGQNPFLAVNPGFSLRAVVGEPLRIAGIARGRIKERVGALFSLLELSERLLERRPHELSGGELQRAVLARALALEPEFLVLDEPFSALDDLTAWRLLMQFRKIFQRLGLGILFISHHPRHIRLLADRVLVLEKGRLNQP